MTETHSFRPPGPAADSVFSSFKLPSPIIPLSAPCQSLSFWCEHRGKMLFFELQHYTQTALSAATKSTAARPLRCRGGLRAARSKQPRCPVGSVNETQKAVGLGSTGEFKAGADFFIFIFCRSQTRIYKGARAPVCDGARHCLFLQCSQAVGRW